MPVRRNLEQSLGAGERRVDVVLSELKGGSAK